MFKGPPVWTKADSFWRDPSPSTNMTWTSMAPRTVASAKVTESTLRNLDHLLTSSARRKEDDHASDARGVFGWGCA